MSHCSDTIKRIEEKGEETRKTENTWFGTRGPTSTGKRRLIFFFLMISVHTEEIHITEDRGETVMIMA